MNGLNDSQEAQKRLDPEVVERVAQTIAYLESQGKLPPSPEFDPKHGLPLSYLDDAMALFTGDWLEAFHYVREYVVPIQNRHQHAAVMMLQMIGHLEVMVRRVW